MFLENIYITGGFYEGTVSFDFMLIVSLAY